MCTAISWKSKDCYFGRNLDLERGYNERVVITPRNYEFPLRLLPNLKKHYGMIGMAAVVNHYPLYFDATNECGLSMAGLHFPGNAVYEDPQKAPDRERVTPFEFIPWVLGQCGKIEEVKILLDKMSMVHVNFSKELPLSPLHWMISDKKCSIVVESTKDGLKVYDNPFEVLTNNPAFSYHQMNLNNYMGLQAGPSVNQFHKNLPLHNYSLGMGALGLPGDFSSASRFVRAFFVKENSVTEEDEATSVNQFFHILDAAAMPKGCVWTKNGYEYTRYSSCCNADKGIYYYKTYDQFKILSVNLHDADLDGKELSFE